MLIFLITGNTGQIVHSRFLNKIIHFFFPRPSWNYYLVGYFLELLVVRTFTVKMYVASTPTLDINTRITHFPFL